MSFQLWKSFSQTLNFSLSFPIYQALLSHSYIGNADEMETHSDQTCFENWMRRAQHLLIQYVFILFLEQCFPRATCLGCSVLSLPISCLGGISIYILLQYVALAMEDVLLFSKDVCYETPDHECL